MEVIPVKFCFIPVNQMALVWLVGKNMGSNPSPALLLAGVIRSKDPDEDQIINILVAGSELRRFIAPRHVFIIIK